MRQMIKPYVRDIYHSTQSHRVGLMTWWHLALSLVVVTVLVAVFSQLADEVIEGSTLPIDRAILLAIREWHTPVLDGFVRIATDIGGVIGVVGLTGLGAALLWWAKKRRAMLQLMVGVGGAAVINLILKSLFVRERPDLWQQIVNETTYSFPSGHSMASSALALSVVLILWHTKWRWWAVAAGSAYTLFVGLSRMYLGVHYPSDVVGAWIISAAWVVLASILIGTIKPRLKSRG